VCFCCSSFLIFRLHAHTAFGPQRGIVLVNGFRFSALHSLTLATVFCCLFVVDHFLEYERVSECLTYRDYPAFKTIAQNKVLLAEFARLVELK
jgi:hypothetical protein